MNCQAVSDNGATLLKISKSPENRRPNKLGPSELNTAVSGAFSSLGASSCFWVPLQPPGRLGSASVWGIALSCQNGLEDLSGQTGWPSCERSRAVSVILGLWPSYGIRAFRPSEEEIAHSLQGNNRQRHGQANALRMAAESLKNSQSYQ
jgi:hypothetical protein